MNIHRLENFQKGWLVGDFDNNILRSKDFEFMVRYYKAGDLEPRHVHNEVDEITVIISGLFKMNDTELHPGDIVHLKPGEPADFYCIEDGANAVVKTPSIPSDKFLV
ncbi:MAG: hypothetical protein RL538_573 [Candidatus Parcubacteria bacterium]|jgi:quercetin dioxygenase-like cupin family protein